MSSPIPSSFVSVFERAFDAVVFGAGFVGLAAVESLRREGCSVLLIESSADVLWEATRALENGAGGAESRSPGWERWLRGLRERSAADGRWFEPARAETMTAAALRAGGRELRVLFQATAVAAECAGGALRSVTVATKAGARRVRARRWVDATEAGVLARLCDAGAVGREPEAVYRSLVLHSDVPERVDARVDALRARFSDLQCFDSVCAGERRLRWREDGRPWHRRAVELIEALREGLEDAPNAGFIVSHIGMRSLPVYAAGGGARCAAPANLDVLSPVFRTEELRGPADRFALGETLAAVAAAESPECADGAAALPAAVEEVRCAVVVAGAGTAGALAGLAATRAGADTLVFDVADYPGGVGTGGGINGYFHGAPGGLFEAVDRRARELDLLLGGYQTGAGGWHHEAKKLALLEQLEESGARFVGDALLCGVESAGPGRVGAALAVVSGRLTRIVAPAFIDCTGDGDLCALAGAADDAGRPGDGRMLAFSQSAFGLARMGAEWRLRSCNFDAGWVDATDPEDLTRARLLGVAQHDGVAWSGKERVVAMAPLLGLRQSRHVVTDTRVALEDMVSGRRFADTIGLVKTVADTHSVDYEFEDDELAFYYWTACAFREELRCELPYGMLLPKGLVNVWIACRAAGMTMGAAYGLRMQRDMQRLGEAAGLAAAQVAGRGGVSREVDVPALQAALDHSGARRPLEEAASPGLAELLAKLDAGAPGVHLWRLYRTGDAARAALSERLDSSAPCVSFYAAAVLAMSGEPRAEARLLSALSERETGWRGATPVGAFGQCIALPFWLQALVLLRRIGSAACLPELKALAGEGGLPFNVRTILALTVERLAGRLGADARLVEVLALLKATAGAGCALPPSRSLWLEVAGEPQKRLANDRGADVRDDHAWQLRLVIARAERALGLPVAGEDGGAGDARGYVRRAFAELEPGASSARQTSCV